MNRKKGKENKKHYKSLIDHKDLERNVLEEISKELIEKSTNKTPKEMKNWTVNGPFFLFG